MGRHMYTDVSAINKSKLLAELESHLDLVLKTKLFWKNKIKTALNNFAILFLLSNFCVI